MSAPVVPVKTMALVSVILITTDVNALWDLRDRTAKVCDGQNNTQGQCRHIV